jgi:hypothetical protein
MRRVAVCVMSITINMDIFREERCFQCRFYDAIRSEVCTSSRLLGLLRSGFLQWEYCFRKVKCHTV